MFDATTDAGIEILAVATEYSDHIYYGGKPDQDQHVIYSKINGKWIYDAADPKMSVSAFIDECGGLPRGSKIYRVNMATNAITECTDEFLECVGSR